MAKVIGMMGKTTGLLLGLAVMLSPFVGALDVGDRVINVSQTHEVVECKPGSVPETSIIDKTRNDLERFLNPEDYRQKYPEKCSLWKKRYVVEGDSTHTYDVEVIKYVGEDWKALISVQKDGEGVGYADVDIGEKDVGATNPDGRLKVRLPEDDFVLHVRTSDGTIRLDGAGR